jgi:DNA-binding LytR/AlgR family response regulator
MILARALGDAVGSSMSTVTPIVFIVDDDVSVRESLELLIQNEGWQAETFASAHEFSITRELLFQAVSSLTFHFRASTAWNCSSE